MGSNPTPSVPPDAEPDVCYGAREHAGVPAARGTEVPVRAARIDCDGELCSRPGPKPRAAWDTNMSDRAETDIWFRVRGPAR